MLRLHPTFLSVLLIVPFLWPASASQLGAPYTTHGPLACVDGLLRNEYDGRTYDPSLVSGLGTPEAPYVLEGVTISLTAHAAYPAGILLNRCPHFHLQDSQLDGRLERAPACRGPERVREGETATYGILAIESPGLRVEGSHVRYGRLAGIHLEGGEARILRSDITSNFGAGVRATRGAWVNLTENYIAYNGWFMPESPPTRDGRILPTWAAGVYLDEGAYVEAYNNSLYRNENAVNVDKSLDVTTSGVLNYNTIEASDWAAVVVVGQGEENPMGWCTDNGAPSWWGIEERPPEPEQDEASSTQEHQASARLPGLPGGDPLYEGVPDSDADPLHVVNVRLNFWGQFNGPSPTDTQGQADFRFWLPTQSPRVALAGAAREQGIGRDYDLIASTIEETIQGLLP